MYVGRWPSAIDVEITPLNELSGSATDFTLFFTNIGQLNNVASVS